jgi:hypothetical protein
MLKVKNVRRKGMVNKRGGRETQGKDGKELKVKTG